MGGGSGDLVIGYYCNRQIDFYWYLPDLPEMGLSLESYPTLLYVSKLYESTGRELYQGTHFQIPFVLAGGWCWSSKYCRGVEAAQALCPASSRHLSNLGSKSEVHCSRDKCVFHANADRNPSVVGNSMSSPDYSSICSISALNPNTWHSFPNERQRNRKPMICLSSMDHLYQNRK